MKLVIATPLYPPEPGGPATYVRILEEELPKYGVTPTIIPFSQVRHLPPIIRHVAYYLKIRRAGKHADAILALDPVSVGFPALKAAQALKKPFVVKIVGDYAWEQGTQRFGVSLPLDEFVQTPTKSFFVRLLQMAQTYVAQHAVRVVVPSEYLRNIVSLWGIDKEKISVIYNSVELGTFGAVPEGIRNLPRPHLTSIGRLVPWKNFKGVIDVVHQLSKGALIIVGDGPDKKELVAYAKNKNMVVHFTGALSHPDTLSVLQDTDVFILNSTYEGLSHLLIEALSLGVPTVATRAGGNIELLAGEENSVLVEVGDIASLKNGIEKALTFSKGAGEYARARFSKERMLKSTTELLTSLV